MVWWRITPSTQQFKIYLFLHWWTWGFLSASSKHLTRVYPYLYLTLPTFVYMNGLHMLRECFCAHLDRIGFKCATDLTLLKTLGKYSLAGTGLTELKTVFLRMSKNPSFLAWICPKIPWGCLFVKTTFCHASQNHFTASWTSPLYLCPLLVSSLRLRPQTLWGRNPFSESQYSVILVPG